MRHKPDFLHGDDGYRYPVDIIADFSSNVWKDGTNDALIRHLASNMAIIGKYPQLHAESLAEEYAKLHKCDHSQVLVTNGTSEAIFLIAQIFRNSNSTIVIPSFSEYEHACTLFNHQISYVDIGSIAAVKTTAPGLFWFCNPNNPTGHYFGSRFIVDLAKSNRQTVFIVDEAYIDICIDGCSITEFLDETENVIVLRSMTKHFSIPGLRLGYVVGNKGIVSELFSFQPPWSVNSLAIAAGHFLLNHHQLCSIDISGWIDESKKLGQSLADITGWEAYPSSTAYFLMKTTIPSAIIKHELIGRYGILIRDASNFRGLDDYHVRICSQDESKNRLLVDAVKDLFGSVPKV